VGCGAVAGGTSGSFRWYRDAPPLRPARPARNPDRRAPWLQSSCTWALGCRGCDNGLVEPTLRPEPVSSPEPEVASTAATGSPTGPPRASDDDAFDGRPGLPDRFGRALRDLRISVTDRCNFRCPYCMPAELFGRDFAFLPRDQMLTFEEITRLAGIFVDLGVGKLRITGGEPLVRRDLPVLVSELASLRTPEVARSTSP